MIELDTNWQDRYAGMLSRPKRALRHIRSGHRVFIGTGCAEPVQLVEALTARADELADVEIVQLFTKGEAAYADPRLAGSFRLNSFFIGKNVLEVVRAGAGGYTPVLLSAVPALFNSGRLPLDVALVQVTPPDRLGRVSLGISVDIVKSAIDNASLVIAQVNAQMPWTEGDSLLDIADLDLLVPADRPLLEQQPQPAHPIAREIGRRVAALIPDGATIQFGLGSLDEFGRIPQAAAEFLHQHRDLGIHTEMATDALLELIDAGAISGRRKNTDRGRIVCSFCMGSRRLYDTVHDNPLFCFRPTEFVNDATVIARQTGMVAINLAREIDLTGQVCADSADGQFVGGIGGLVDFTRGALRAKNGRSILVLPSTSASGQRSTIVARLAAGSGVTVNRGEVQYVVTEYGAADLYGKSIQQRVQALIAIAHPRFRAVLFQEALEQRLLPVEMTALAATLPVDTDGELAARMLLEDGTEIHFRPISPADVSGLRAMFYTLSPESVYYRFGKKLAGLSGQQLQEAFYVGAGSSMALIGTIPEAHGEEIVAAGKYICTADSGLAELCLLVRDDWQNRGLGSFLFHQLAAAAGQQGGVRGFTARVLRENQRMQAIFHHAGPEVRSTLEGDNYLFTWTWPPKI